MVSTTVMPSSHEVAVQDLQGRHHARRRREDVLRRERAVRAGTLTGHQRGGEEEGELHLHTRVVPRGRPHRRTGCEDLVLEDHSVVGFVEAERLLHRDGREADLEARDPSALSFTACAPQSLDLVGIRHRHRGMPPARGSDPGPRARSLGELIHERRHLCVSQSPVGHVHRHRSTLRGSVSLHTQQIVRSRTDIKSQHPPNASILHGIRS